MFSALTLFSGPYALLARFVTAGLVVLSIFAYGWFKGHSSAQEAFDQYRAKVEALGEAQAKHTAEVIKADKARKEQSDATFNTRITALKSDNDRLQRNANSSSLPTRAPDSACPANLACFDREELDRAIRDFTSETAAIAGKGEAVRLQLTTAIEWAR